MDIIVKIGTPAFRRKLVEWAPFSSIQDAKKIVDVMDSTSRSIYEHKKEALAKGDQAVTEQIGDGIDIMSILSVSFIQLPTLGLPAKDA